MVAESLKNKLLSGVKKVVTSTADGLGTVGQGLVASVSSLPDVQTITDEQVKRVTDAFGELKKHGWVCLIGVPGEVSDETAWFYVSEAIGHAADDRIQYDKLLFITQSDWKLFLSTGICPLTHGLHVTHLSEACDLMRTWGIKIHWKGDANFRIVVDVKSEETEPPLYESVIDKTPYSIPFDAFDNDFIGVATEQYKNDKCWKEDPEMYKRFVIDREGAIGPQSTIGPQETVEERLEKLEELLLRKSNLKDRDIEEADIVDVTWETYDGK
mgnify:CR=1 FL=1